MEMQRAGNPLMIYWNFNLRKENEEVEVFPLEGKPLRLTLITPRGKKEIKDYAVKGSVIEWKFTSDYQKAYGDYSLMLEVLSPSGKVLMTADQCGFARIADKTCFSTSAVSSDTITLTSELTVVRIMPVFPEIGPNGNWWVDGVDTGNPARGEKGDVVDASYMEFDVDDDMTLNLTFISTNDQLSLDFEIDENGYLTVDK